MRKEAGLFCGSLLRKGEVFAYVGRNQNLKDLKEEFTTSRRTPRRKRPWGGTSPRRKGRRLAWPHLQVWQNVYGPHAGVTQNEGSTTCPDLQQLGLAVPLENARAPNLKPGSFTSGLLCSNFQGFGRDPPQIPESRPVPGTTPYNPTCK
jgi:hypothetical protein